MDKATAFLANLSAAELRSLPGKYYPLFDVVHIALCVLAVRKEAGRKFGWDHPFATLVSCVLASFAGSILANPWLGKPMFGAFSDERLLVICFVLYCGMFFAPGDLLYKLITFKPIYLGICIIKEIYRGKKIFAGLQAGKKAFPDSPFFIPAVVAVIKGNGSAFMNPFARAVRGDWRPAATEFMKPSVTTKECVLAALVLLFYPTQDAIYIALVGLFLAVKVGSVFGQSVDPFKPVEAIFWGLVGVFESAPEDKGTEKKKQ